MVRSWPVSANSAYSVFQPPAVPLEEHHVVNEANDADLTITLCFNCHWKLTERMRANGTSMHTPKSCLYQLVAFLWVSRRSFGC